MCFQGRAGGWEEDGDSAGSIQNIRCLRGVWIKIFFKCWVYGSGAQERDLARDTDLGIIKIEMVIEALGIVWSESIQNEGEKKKPQCLNEVEIVQKLFPPGTMAVKQDARERCSLRRVQGAMGQISPSPQFMLCRSNP